MANFQKLIDLDGLSYFLGQIKAKFVRSVNGVKPDSKGNVNIANMEGATSNAAGKAGLVPIPATGKQDMALCGDATFKVLPIAGGGTGQTTVAGVRNILGLGNTDGALPIEYGGTGATTISAACEALGLDWDWLHRYGENYVPSDVTNKGWNSLGLCLIYYTEVKIKNQPSTYGQLLNIPASKTVESTQIWIEQSSGKLYFRGGNGEIIVNDTAFTKVATDSGIVADNLAQNGYVKFSNGLILQWGTITTSEGGNQLQSYPISYSNAVYATVINQQTGNASHWSDAHITYTSLSRFKWYSGAGTWRYITIGK